MLHYLATAVTGGRIGAEEVTDYSVVWEIRTPRVLLAAVAGAGLSAVGVAVVAPLRQSRALDALQCLALPPLLIATLARGPRDTPRPPPLPGGPEGTTPQTPAFDRARRRG